MDAYLLKGVILFLFFCFNLFVEKQNIFLYILFCVFFIYRVCIVLSIYGVNLFPICITLYFKINNYKNETRTFIGY